VSTVNPIKVYFTPSEQEYLNFTRANPTQSERDAAGRRLELELVLVDGTPYPQKGRFHVADRQVDQKTGAIRIAGIFPNPGDILRPGQYGRVRAVTSIREGALLVPQRAVTELQGSYQVAVVGGDNKVSFRPVDDLRSAEAAPLLCAGITTYNALRNAGLRGGDLVAVQGIGGLGHLGIQFARHMGFHTVAIGRGREKEKLAKDLGAHVYIDTAVDDAAAVLQRMGGARAILATAPSGDAMGPLVSGLAARGKLIVVGVPQDPIQLSAFPLVFGGRSIYGTLAGTAIETEDTLAFSVLENIRPMIEAVPLEQAADAYARMMHGKARFRMVLVTKDGVAQSLPIN
jgi:NADPH:quinone reductase-like Zn-dependent oxidoreductase